jgi:hypothetical protein
MKNTNKKVSRNFEEVEGGHYDNVGFYHTPNGSFWDTDGIYFDRTGKDVHGGYYDQEKNYHPGEGWVDSLMCYEDEIMNINPNSNILDEFNDYEDGDYDVYEDINEDLNMGNIKGQSYYDVVGKNNNNNMQNNNNNNKNIGQKMQVFNKITLKDDTPNNKTSFDYPQNSAYSNFNNKNNNYSNSHSNNNKLKQPNLKEVVEVDKITSDTVVEALKSNKDVKVDGYTISEGIDLSDDENPKRSNNKRGGGRKY